MRLTGIVAATALIVSSTAALAIRLNVPESENVTGRKNVSKVCDGNSKICVISFRLEPNDPQDDTGAATQECLKRGMEVVHNRGMEEFEIAQIWTAGGGKGGQRIYMAMCKPS